MANTLSNSPLSLCLLLLAGVAPAAFAGDWRITPTVNVSERYTDNVTLVGAGQESSFITDISPGIEVQRSGARGSVNINYSLHGLIYSHDGDQNAFQNQLAARIRTEPISEFFFLDADASVQQANISQLGQVGSGYNTTANQAETRSISVTPSIRKRFGGQATANLRWALTYANSDAGAVNDSSGNSLDFSLTSGAAFNRVPWSLFLRRSTADNNTAADTVQKGISAYVGYRATPKVQIGVNLGRDDNSGSTTLNSLNGSYGNLSLQWAPTARTDLGATLGRRYNGNSYGLNFTHRTARTVWGLRYSEDISDTYSQLTGTGAFDIYNCGGLADIRAAGSPPPAGCTLHAAAAPLPIASLVNDISLNKSWSGTVSYRLGKSTFTAGLNSSRRTLLRATTSSDETYSISGAWSWLIGPRTTSVLSLSQSSATSGATDGDTWTLGWTLSRRLAARTTGNIELRRLDRTGGTTGDYSENSVAATLSHRF